MLYTTTCVYMLKAIHNWVWKALFPGRSRSAHTQCQSRVLCPFQPLNVVWQKDALEVNWVRGSYHFLFSLGAEEKEVMEWQGVCGGLQSHLPLWKWVLYLEGLHNSLPKARCCSYAWEGVDFPCNEYSCLFSTKMHYLL